MNPDNNVERKQNQSVTLVSVYGGPGTGKDTNILFLKGELISRGYKESEICMISTGDIVRGSMDINNYYYKYHDDFEPYYQIMKEGKLLPDDVIAKVYVKEIQQRIKDGVKVILTSGYPRTRNQKQKLDNEIENLKNTQGIDISVVNLAYYVSDETCIKRVIERNNENLAKGIPTRSDDTPEAMEVRLKIHHTDTDPLVDDLRKNGDLIEIDASPEKKIVAAKTFEALYFIKPGEKIHTRNGMVI